MSRKTKPESELVVNYRRAWLALDREGTQEEKDSYLKAFTSGDQSRAFLLGMLVGFVMTVSCGIWVAVA